MSTGRQKPTGSVTDRGKLLLIAEALEQATPVGRHGDWIEITTTWATITVAELRAIAKRMDCSIKLRVNCVPQGEPEIYRAIKTGFDEETGATTFSIIEGEAINEST